MAPATGVEATQHGEPPLYSSPSPLAGEGWGGGYVASLTPTPALPHLGGGRSISGDGFLDERDLLGDELHRPVAASGDDRVGVDAEQVVERPAEALHLVELVGHLVALLVG